MAGRAVLSPSEPPAPGAGPVGVAPAPDSGLTVVTEIPVGLIPPLGAAPAPDGGLTVLTEIPVGLIPPLGVAPAPDGGLTVLTEIPVGLIPPLGAAARRGALPAGLPASMCFGSRVNSGAPPALGVRVVGEAKASEGPPRCPVAPHHPC